MSGLSGFYREEKPAEKIGASKRRSDDHTGVVCCPRADLFVIVEEMANRSYLGECELMILLAVIRLGDDAYGVPISKELLEITGREIALGSIYAALDRLEHKGLVTSRLGDPTPARGGRAKRYFRVTSRGMREVKTTRTALVRLWGGIPQLQGESA